jgi:hypothetical protein
MKTKHIVATTGTAIIAGSVFYYYLPHRLATKADTLKPARQPGTGKIK